MTELQQTQTRNFRSCNFPTFDKLDIARREAEEKAAAQKAVWTSFYAPQIYQYQTVGVFGTMFGTQRGKYAILLFRPKSPKEIELDEWREAFWPTTREGRIALDIETKRLKAQEDLEKTTGWRMKTWPKRTSRRMGRHVQHLLKHHSFAEKEAPTPFSPFWELRGRPIPWQTRVPEVKQVLGEQKKAAKKSALIKTVPAKKFPMRKPPVSKVTAQASTRETLKEKSLEENVPATGAEQEPAEQQLSEQNAPEPKTAGKRLRVRWNLKSR